MDYDGSKFTGLQTYTALDTGALVYDVDLFLLAGNGADRTLSGTGSTADALICKDRIPDQLLTGSTWASLVLDMGTILLREILHA